MRKIDLALVVLAISFIILLVNNLKVETTTYKAQLLEKSVVGKYEPYYYLIWKNLETGEIQQEKTDAEGYASTVKGHIYIKEKQLIKLK